MFHKLRQSALNNKVPIIKPEAENIIIQELNNIKPKNVVEIWTAVWYSSLVIWNTIQTWEGKLTTFEISYLAYIEALANFHKFKQYNITAYNIDPLWINLEKIFIKEKIDFLFIDAIMKFYLYFLLSFKDLLKNDCTILLDNVVKFKSKTITLYEFLEKNQINYEIFFVPPNDGIMKIKFNNKLKLL